MNWVYTLTTLTGLLLSCALMAQSEEPMDALLDGDTLQAKILLERKIKQNPFDSIALNNLAIVLAGQGELERAAELLHQATLLAPMRKEIKHNKQIVNAALLEREHTGGVHSVKLPEFLTIAQYPAPPDLW